MRLLGRGEYLEEHVSPESSRENTLGDILKFLITDDASTVDTSSQHSV